MASNINLGRRDMVKNVTLVMKTIPYKYTWKRPKINFMIVLGTKKGITKATESFEKIVMKRTVVK